MNLKELIVVSAIVCFTIINAKAEGKTSSISTSEDNSVKKIEMRQKMLKHTGGMVARPGSQKGEIVFVNCQSIVNENCIKERASYFANQTKCKVEVRTGVFDLNAPKVQGDATVFVVDNVSLPTLLVAPENKWALVNISQLKTGLGARSSFLEARTKKELNRAFVFLCGGITSQYSGSAATCITKPDDLDQIVEMRLPIDLFQRFKGYMLTLGISPAELVPYRKACEEGWAPSPTNDYQKVVWDDVHAEKERGPSKAIQIKP